MGILNKLGIGSQKKGLNCKVNNDGTKTCVTIKTNDNGDIIATGSELTWGIDPNRCKPVIVGSHTILDEDKGKFESEMAEDIKACRSGVRNIEGGTE